MELETLEVIIDANTEKLEKQFAKIAPFVEKTMNMLGKMSEKGVNNVEKNLDVDKGVSKLEKQLEKMNQNFERQMEFMEKSSAKSTESIGTNMSKGFSKARKTVGKDIDSMVNDINSKMGQAKAQQEKLAFLKSQRQGRASKQDTKGTVKYDEQIAAAQAKMTKYHDEARKLAQSMKAEYDSIPTSLDTISNKMMENEGQIESMRSKIRSLQSEYDRVKTPKGSFSSGFSGSIDNGTSLKIKDQIEQQSRKMSKLVQDNDSLQQAYAQTEDRAGSLKIAIQKVNTEMGKTSRQTETAGSGVRRFGRNTTQSRGLFSRFSNVVGRFGSIAHKGFNAASSGLNKFTNLFNRNSTRINRQSKSMTSGISGFSRRLGQMVKQAFIFSLIYKGLQLIVSGMGSALKSNTEFSNSLNQIKVNLLTVFYPIYTAILPAINTLMKAISIATAYLAEFIATLFGTTYSAAKQGAQGLYQNIQAMNETGTQADKTKEKVKQLQRSLMGFDEINNLSKESDDDTSLDNKNGVDFSGADPVIPDSVTNWAAQFKKLLTDFFKPIQQAWDAQGKKVMQAWKRALNEVIGLAGAIGRSFMKVWTNGTGKKFIENILILFADVLNIIGDIAGAFKRAWEDGGRGDRVIQSIFDKWNSILELLHEVAESFRKAWNSGEGEKIAGNLLDIYTNVNNIIGNLAEGFKNAWKEGGRGESIFTGIMKIVNNILGSIEEMTEATAKWAKKLDFRPLLDSIDNLLQAIEPLTQSVFDGLAWFYENVLLPLASFVITDLIPIFIDRMAGAIKIISGVIDIFKPLVKWFFEEFLIPLASWTGGKIVDILNAFNDVLNVIGDWLEDHMDILQSFVEIGVNLIDGLLQGIKDALANVGEWLRTNVFDPIVNWFKSLFGIHSPSTVFAEFGGFLISGLFNGISNTMGTVVELVSGLFNDIKEAVLSISSDIWEGAQETWGNIKQTVEETAGSIWESASTKFTETKDSVVESCTNIYDSAVEKWNGAKDAVSDATGKIFGTTKKEWNNVSGNTLKNWTSIGKSISDTVTNSKKWVSEKFTGVRDFTNRTWSGLSGSTDKSWKGVSKSVDDSATKSRKSVSENWDNANKKTSSVWSSIRKLTGTDWSNVNTTIKDKATNSQAKVSSAWFGMKSKVTEYNSSIKSNTKSAFDSIAGWAGNLGSRMGSGLSKGVGSIKIGAAKIGNGLVGTVGKALNGVVNGVNWVLKKVGAGSAAIGKWTIPTYATGTNAHPGGLALVNDGSGANYQEAYQTPGGNVGIFPAQRNMLVNLPQGAKVLSGPKTAQMYGNSIPKYANGVGDWFAEKWNGTKKMTGEIWDYVTKPAEALKIGISNYVDLKKEVEPRLSMAKGAVATTASKAVSMIKGKMEAGYDEYLASNASEGGSGSYAPHFGSPFVKTSDYGPRPNLYGDYHTGVDFAAPLGTSLPAQYPGQVSYSGWATGYGNLVGIKVANAIYTLYGHMNSVSTKVGQAVKKGQSIGQVGSTGWSTGPHVHYELQTGKMFGQHVNPYTYGAPTPSNVSGEGSSNNNYGSAVERWRSTVNRALRMVGQYSTGNADSTLYQMKTESGGNPYAINNWDINAMNGTPSKGLMQVIDPTFKAYAMSGYNKNIWDPISNILASMRYAIARYGSLAAAYRGVGYENGGLISQDGVYRLGEGNKKEMIIPLEKPSRAIELIQKASEYLGIDTGYQTLQLPEVFRTDNTGNSSSIIQSYSNQTFEGGGISGMAETMVNGIITGLQTMGVNATQNSSSNGDIVINIGGTEFGRIAVKEINNYQNKLGYTELNI